MARRGLCLRWAGGYAQETLSPHNFGIAKTWRQKDHPDKGADRHSVRGFAE